MSKLVVFMLAVVASGPAFGNTKDNGLPPYQYDETSYTRSLVNEAKTVALWPGYINFNYSETRRDQGVYPELMGARLVIDTVQLRNVFELNESVVSFDYKKHQDSNATVDAGLSYQEYLDVFHTIKKSALSTPEKKVTPVLNHKIKETLRVFRLHDHKEIAQCRIEKIETANLVFQIGNDRFEFERSQQLEETKIETAKCEEQIALFEGKEP